MALYAPDATDLNFTAAFLSAAADKTGHISQDMVVYINSILGINKVVGYSAYEEDGHSCRRLPSITARTPSISISGWYRRLQ